MPATMPGDPRRVGPYRVVSRLGAGGMGQVFLGRSPGGRTVAIKVVHPAMADDPGFRSRFQREVTAARAVNGVYTAPIVDADPDAPLPWLATAFLPGLSLQDAIAAHGPLPAPAVRALGAGLAEALVSIHRAGIVHRDLKPSNVMLTPEGPRVIDFGIARASDASVLTRTGATIGTPSYMAPEQAAGSPVGPPADVFSLGAVLTYASAGVGPFGRGAVHELIYRVIHLPPDLRGVADPALRDLIAACLDKDPDRRPPADRLVSLLAPSDAPDGTGWLPPPVAHDVSRRPSAAPGRRRVLLGAGALVATAGVGAAALRMSRSPSTTLWTYDLPDRASLINGPYALAGTVYAAGGSGLVSNTWALDPRTGRSRWEGSFSPARKSEPVVADGRGFVCSGGNPGSVDCFDVASGRQLWSKQLSTFAYVPVLTATAGLVCLTGSEESGSYGLYAFDAATGDPRWTYHVPQLIQGNATLSGGLFYLGQTDFLYAVDAATGGGRWQRHVAGLSQVTPSAGGGVVVVASQDYTVRAFDASTGAPRWTASLMENGSSHFEVTPLIAGDVVYVGGQSGVLHALSLRDGRALWSFDSGNGNAVGDTDYLTPTVSGGVAVLSNDDTSLYAIEASGHLRWRQTVAKGLGVRPVIVGRRVYHAGVEGVYGFDLGTGRLVYRLDQSDVPDDMMASVEHLTTANGVVYCAVGSRRVYAIRAE